MSSTNTVGNRLHMYWTCMANSYGTAQFKLVICMDVIVKSLMRFVDLTCKLHMKFDPPDK